MLSTPRQERRRRLFWHKLIVIMTLVGTLGLLTAHMGAASAHAATQPAPNTSIDQFGRPAILTAGQQALTTDKTKLSDEYARQVRSGKETLATFEGHYRAFLNKWKLGGTANLHTALTRSAARSQALIAQSCPSAAVSSDAAMLCSVPVGAAQFPEESYNWCGPATLSTTLVEDSFIWSGTNSYNGFTISYNHYIVSQPSGIATNDEYWLAADGVITNDGSNDWIHNNGTSVQQMNDELNKFVGGKGGWYNPFQLAGTWSYQMSNFQSKVSSDIATGWDVPTGLYIPAYSGVSMPGYPNWPALIQHWVPVTFISSDLNTTYYSDPVYGAPAYSGWPINSQNLVPYENTPTSNIVWWGTYILW